MSLECPRCRQIGYNVGMSFHWCGDYKKQCAICGQDWPSDRCPKCYKVGTTHGKGIKFDGVDESCSECGKLTKGKVMPIIQKIKLPYPYPWKGNTRKIEGWTDNPGCLLISMPSDTATGTCSPSTVARWTQADGDELVEPLSRTESQKLLQRLGLMPENIPGYKKPKGKIHEEIMHPAFEFIPPNPQTVQTEYVSLTEWEEFQRWKDRKKELEDLSDDNLSNWKELLDTITSSYPEFDEELDDLFEGLRRMPRLIRCIRTGDFPPMELDDDNLAYYDESVALTPSYHYDNYNGKHKRGKLVVKVVIEDISDGRL